MIYYFEEIEKFKEEEFKYFYKFLPKFRKDKIEKLKFFKDKKLSLLGYILFLYGLRVEKRDFSTPIFSYLKYNKPYIKNVFFNISHCKSGVVCIISNNNVGIDIENIDKNHLSLLDTVMNKNEEKIILNSKIKENTFTRLWTIKESYLKNIGTGLIDDLKLLDFSNFKKDEYIFDDKFFRIYKNKKNYICSCSVDSMELINVNLFDLKKIIN
ncbi:MAG: 4'-phosphopantetheinyl transferase superfamily protein [Peptostreptococcaceae bacterium]|jgi:4'-phosphopantetheinyl transferase|nr:4'-phosphopantetheinyl transferase superfamily protein [Peptostreptococcaceae bacterium]